MPDPTPEANGPSGSSPLAAERLGPGLAPVGFWVGALILFGGTLLVLLLLVDAPSEPLDQEGAMAQEGSPWGLAARVLTMEGMRGLAVVATALAVVASTFAGRRLLHSSSAGLFAGALLLTDPAVLFGGRLALPDAFLLAAAAGSLALAVSTQAVTPWLIWFPMAVGVALEPAFILWGVGLMLLLALRGHIYSAPRHLGIAGLQAIGLPAAIAATSWVVARAVADGRAASACTTPGLLDQITMQGVVHAGGTAVLVHNPILWWAGTAAAIVLVVAALGHAGTRFRLSRVPGRVQIRLPGLLPVAHARSLWLGLLLLAAAASAGLLLPAALALAHGTRILGQDAPTFAWPIQGAMLAFAIVYLVRLLPLLDGSAQDPAALVGDVVPWATMVPCD